MKPNYLTLINRKNKIKNNQRMIDLVRAPFTKESIYLEREVASQLEKLINSIEAQEDIVIVDGYRTKETQAKLWDETIVEKGEVFTNKYVARPGCSEHEVGLAVDLGLAAKENDFIRPSFTDSEIVHRFLENMGDYGFILRYPKNKEHITQISYEPWHFRYVGAPHSQIITQQGWVLEEYIEFLTQSQGEVNGI